LAAISVLKLLPRLPSSLPECPHSIAVIFYPGILVLGHNVNPEYGFTLVRLGNFKKAADTFQKMIAADDVLSKARGYRSIAFLAMYQRKL
jgi:hypothetical protein